MRNDDVFTYKNGLSDDRQRLLAQIIDKAAQDVLDLLPDRHFDNFTHQSILIYLATNALTTSILMNNTIRSMDERFVIGDIKYDALYNRPKTG